MFNSFILGGYRALGAGLTLFALAAALAACVEQRQGEKSLPATAHVTPGQPAAAESDVSASAPETPVRPLGPAAEKAPASDQPMEMKFDSGQESGQNDGPGEVPGAKVPAGMGYYYSVYAGSYADKAAAQKVVGELSLKGLKGEVITTTRSLVRIMVTDDYELAKATMEKMEGLGFPEAFVTRRKGRPAEPSQ